MYFGIIVVSLALAMVGLLLKVLSSKDLLDRSEAIDILTLVTSALYKLLFFSVKHEKFRWVVMKCSKFEKLLPDGWNSMTSKLSILHSMSAFAIMSFWSLCPILNWLLGVISWESLSLPINSLAPKFDGFMFGLIYLWGCISLLSSAQIYMAADIFCFSSIHMVNGAMETLKLRLEDMRKISAKDDKDGKEPRHEFLKSWINDHIEIMDYIHQVDLMMRSMIVADVLHAIISLSFAMLQSSESQNFLDWVKGSLFIIVCFVHQYLNSHFGQKLIDQQEAIRKSVSEIPWDEGSVPLMKTVLIIANGTLKPVRLSAWRMYFLQYATFVEFVKTMVSWFMVLRQLNDEK
ncbi:uncharacterized protein LOC106669355 isoform X2 [Cimex lectularius]|nr:uncharacterized protein LOC106669355 isoform X2 [Cimex lectularius]